MDAIDYKREFLKQTLAKHTPTIRPEASKQANKKLGTKQFFFTFGLFTSRRALVCDISGPLHLDSEFKGQIFFPFLPQH